MELYFRAKTNKNYCSINKAIFHLTNGGTLSVDRGETEYTIENGNLEMVWHGVYLWEFNGLNIFAEEMVYPSEGLNKLLEGSSVEFELEDDAESDYLIWNAEWSDQEFTKQKELVRLLIEFNKKLTAAQDARSDLIDFLTEEYDFDENSEYIDDDCDWCNGIDDMRLQRFLERNGKKG